VKFGAKLKDLRKQAQDAVTENREKIHEAVDVVSTAVDQKTGGKHSAKIAKFGEQADAAVDRFSDSDDETGGKSKPGDGSSPRSPSGATGSTSPGTSGSAPHTSARSAPPDGGEPYGGTPPSFDE
jgi:antitoxin protein of toxin-antitoxin system